MNTKQESQIKRINEASALAKGAWFSLLAFQAFIGVTLLSLRDAHFLLTGEKTNLPVIGIGIPTSSFFYLAPIFGAALYFNLHMLLSKLWEAFEDAKPRIDGDPLADYVQPWLVNDLALSIKSGTNPRDLRMARLRNTLTIGFVWLAEPVFQALFCIRSLPAHDLRMTLLIFACFTVTAWVGVDSWMQAQRRLKEARVPRMRRGLMPATVSLLGLGLGAATLLLGGSPPPSVSADTGDAELAIVRAAFEPILRPGMNLSHENLVGLPHGWRPREAERLAFRKTWCAAESVDLNVCGNMPAAEGLRATNRLVLQRRGGCLERNIRPGRPCQRYFDQLDRRFDAAWRLERRSQIAQIAEFDLRGLNLRGASAQEVKLVHADLTGADLTGADLKWAELEGATLERATLVNVEGYDAKLDQVNLTGADLRYADLNSASFEGATFIGARLNHALLRVTRLVAADLTRSNLEGADLREATLHRAKLDGANLSGADLSGVTGLTQRQLDNTVGDAKTKLPFSRAPFSTEKLHVWSCWKVAPADLEPLLKDPRLSPDDRAYLTDLACAPEETRTPVGTQAALRGDAR